jgi:D-hydroxyproline dehydrogenase subunit gamma
MFELLPLSEGAKVCIDINGAPHVVAGHLNVSAAMLEAGLQACRVTPISGLPRGPFCMMGVCFDCLVEIDGVPNQQGCMVQVRDGMRILPMQGKARIA